MDYKMKFVKICDWIDWCNIFKKNLIEKKLDYQNVFIIIGNIKLYINSLKLFYKFLLNDWKYKKLFIKRWIIQYILYENKFNI